LRKTQVVGANAVGVYDSVNHGAYGRGTDEKSVVVVMDAGVVAVVVKTEFCGLALGEKVLDV
jgi:hypothetical protein